METFERPPMVRRGAVATSAPDDAKRPFFWKIWHPTRRVKRSFHLIRSVDVYVVQKPYHLGLLFQRLQALAKHVFDLGQTLALDQRRMQLAHDRQRQIDRLASRLGFRRDVLGDRRGLLRDGAQDGGHLLVEGRDRFVAATRDPGLFALAARDVAGALHLRLGEHRRWRGGRGDAANARLDRRLAPDGGLGRSIAEVVVEQELANHCHLSCQYLTACSSRSTRLRPSCRSA